MRAWVRRDTVDTRAKRGAFTSTRKVFLFENPQESVLVMGFFNPLYSSCLSVMDEENLMD